MKVRGLILVAKGIDLNSTLLPVRTRNGEIKTQYRNLIIVLNLKNFSAFYDCWYYITAAV